MIEVRKTYDVYNDETIRKSWDVWYDFWAPKNGDSFSYIHSMEQKGIPYHIPLKLILLNKNNYINFPDWENNFNVPNNDINPDFVWPEVIAAAMNSVQSDFNLNLPNPRIYSTTDTDLTDVIHRFKEQCNEYYNTSLKSLNNNILKIMLKRKVGYTGEIASTTGDCFLILFYLSSL
jgi:hypothetical protein